jgi:hypothetical protein
MKDAIIKSELISYISSLRKALQAKAVYKLGDRRFEMFKQGIHSGHLNALDPISPHCVTTEREAEEWFKIGCAHIDSWGDLIQIIGNPDIAPGSFELRGGAALNGSGDAK